LLTQTDFREEEELEKLQVMVMCDSIEFWLSFDRICICGILIVLRITFVVMNMIILSFDTQSSCQKCGLPKHARNSA